jgi:hypothetical protein
MLNNRITKQILKGSLSGRRPAGKPRNSCEDEVWKNAVNCSIQNNGLQQQDM